MTSFRRFSSFAATAALAAMFCLVPASQAAAPLLLQWGTIDTSGAEAQAESAALKAKLAKKAAAARKAGAAAETRAAYVVQFSGPVADEWRAWLEATTEVRGYLPEFAYLVWATPSEMDAIASHEAVLWTGEWKKEYKTVLAGTASAAAKGTASASANAEARWMQVGSLLTDDAGAADLRARLEALPTEVQDAFSRLDGASAVALLTDAQIDEVASWPDVEWIEPKLEPSPFNDKAARTNMMNVTNAWKAISAGGLGLTGAGQIVAVADTGCDKGSLTDTHADFTGRILAGYGWKSGSYGSSYSWADADAHGTHVCGSILGSGAASTNQFRGMAYEAQLVVQGCQANLSGLPNNTHSLLAQAYNAGARIHSDSWGYTNASYHGDYLYAAVYSDGYMWTNQNFLMVIAAGNDGIDADKDGVIDLTSVTPPGTAKNCLCVGASENYRSSGGYSTYGWGSAWPSDYPAAPIKSDKISQTTTPQGLAAFSGRGPTKDGRFKPDIVAPGTDVISVRSRMAEDDGWGIYTGNTNYLYEGGTSMATPLTSGALALVRQWLVDRQGINEPMAALMKALLINGARDMTPGQYGTGSCKEITARPDRSQGFGHVNLYNSLEPGAGNFLVFATNKLSTGNTFTTNIAVGQANAGKYLLTLAWQDYPGSSGGSKNLVNDLDLSVTSPSGTIYYPNNLSGADHTNNVEFIEFAAAETGSYTVRVSGYSVSKTSPHNGQPFALVMRGPETTLANLGPVFSASTASLSGEVGETFSFSFASLLTAGYPAPRYNMSTSVSSYSFNPSTGELSFTPSAAGTYTFTGSAFNDYGTASCTLTVTAALPAPATPTGLTLSDVGATSFTASWNAADYASSYRIDVVEGSDFAAAVGDAVLETGFSDTTGWTLSGTGTYPGYGYYGQSSPSIKFDGTGDYAISPDFGSGVKLQFWAYGNGGSGSSFIISGLVNSAWAHIETVSIANGGATYEVTLPSGTSQLKFDFNKSVNCGLDDVVVYGPGAEAGTYVSGWSNATVNATSVNVTGLQPATAYAVRLRAANSAGISSNSATATATTLAGLSAPVWSSIPPQTVDVGTNCWLNLADYVSGSPAPTISLVSSTADSGDYEFEDGYLMFAPPAATNYTFTFSADNGVGAAATATLTVTGHTERPVLTASLGTSLNSTVGETVDFTVTATGIPAPTTIDATCTEDTYFIFENGEFLFDSPAVGTYHFVFTTTTIGGTDTLTVTLTVSAAPVAVPELTVTNIADTSALATWTACTGVSSYTLQLASDDQFTSASSGASGGFTEDFTGFSSTTYSSTAATQTVASGEWTYVNVIFSPTATAVEPGSQGSAQIQKSGGYLCLPPVDNPTSLAMNVKGSGSGTMNLQQLISGEWETIGAWSVSGSCESFSHTFTNAGTSAALRLRSPDRALYVHDISVSASSASNPGSLISETTVADTSYTFTGLDPWTVYYARVKGTSDWSNVAEFLTDTAGDSAPVWSALPTPSVTVGQTYELDLSDYVTGTPTPSITLSSTTAATGYTFADGALSFTPAATGDFTFTFTAANTEGSSNATLTVAATGTAPSVSVPQTSYSTTLGSPDVEFTVTASGTPTPTLALSDSTATSGYDFDPNDGFFSFTPYATGDFTFTFSATSLLGSDSKTVTVTVSPAPVTVPALAVANVTDATALASWTACDGVSSYTLQLASDDQFTTGGSGGTVTLFSNPATSTTAPANWTYSINSSSSGYLILAANNSVVSESVDASACTDLSLSLAMRTYGGSGAGTTNLLVAYSADNGTSWTDLGTLSVPNKNWTNKTLFANAAAGSASLRFRFASTSPSNSVGVGISNLVLTATQSSGTGSLILSTNVSAASYSFTSLSPSTTYYARVKGTSDWSNVATFTTLATTPADPFEQWLAEHESSGHAAGDEAPNGHTYYESYIADIDPAATNWLEIVIPDASATNFTFAPVSPDRYYQFLYTTNLAGGIYQTNNLDPGATTIPVPDVEVDWYGGLRVSPTPPTTP